MADSMQDTLTEIKVEVPSMYKVILHNDERTTFEFVIMLLQEVFHKSFNDSVIITTLIHEKGSGIAGIYTKEVANEKVHECMSISNAHGYPLLVTAEPE